MTKRKKTDWETRLRLLRLVLTNALVALLILGSYALYPTLRNILNHGSEGSLALTETLRNTAAITESAKPIPGKVAAVADSAKPLVEHADSVVRGAGKTVDSANIVVVNLADLVADARMATMHNIPMHVGALIDQASVAVSRIGPAADAVGELAQQASGTVAVIRPPVLGAISAFKVSNGELAQTMKVIRTAAPKVSDSVVSIGDSAAGIMEDGRVIADRISKPKSPLARLWEAVKVLAGFASRW